MNKIYGPYLRKDGRQHLVIVEDNKKYTISYPKWLMENHLKRKLDLRVTLSLPDAAPQRRTDPDRSMTTATKTATKTRAKVLTSRSAAGLTSFGVPTSAAHGALRLSDPALKPDIAKLKEKLRSDPAFALKTLQSAGIATATGKLTKRFKA